MDRGKFAICFPAISFPESRFDPITRKILDFWPLPNRTPTNTFTQSQNFEDQALTKTNWTQSNFRVDHRFTDRNSMFFRYTHARHGTSGNSIFTDPTVGQNRVDNQINRNAMISDTHTFSPTLLNNLRVGMMRQAFDLRRHQRRARMAGQARSTGDRPRDQFPQIDFGLRHDRRPGVR